MARILILGANGMAGHMARVYLSENGHEIFSVARSSSTDWDSLDAENEKVLFNYIAVRKPEVVLNCVGVLIKESEEDPERAIRLNALLPHVLSRRGNEFGYRLIHISTDCVFSGLSGSYREGDKCDSDEVYGRTKALGEIVNAHDLTIRTSIIGPELKINGTGLFNWFMRQKYILNGFTNVYWGGVTTLEMAKFINYAVKHNTNGLLHLTNGFPISKYDLLHLLKDIWCRDSITIQKDETRISNKSLQSSRNDLSYKVPSYAEMLKELFMFMKSHTSLYNNYNIY